MSEVLYAAVGASYLWPWNCLITAAMFIGPYLHEYPSLQRSYSSCIMLSSTVVNLVGSSWLALKPQDFGYRVRFGQCFIAVGFMLMSILTWLNTKPVPYFFCIMALVLFISVGTTNVQNGVTAITQRIPGGKEARAVLIGQALSGIVPPIFGLILGLTSKDLSAVKQAIKRSIHSLIALEASSDELAEIPIEIPDETNTAVILFLSSSALCLWVLYSFRGPKVQAHIDLSEEESEHIHPSHTLWELFGAIKSPGIAIFMSFAVSLSFSVFANTVTSRVIPERYFCPLTIFLWNAGDLCGRILCESEFFQIRKPRTLVVYGYSRALFLPLLIFISWLGNPSDFIYLAVMLAYGITNGHLVSAAISYAPSCVSAEQRPSAGGLIGMIISFGLVSGAVVSFAIIPFVSV